MSILKNNVTAGTMIAQFQQFYDEFSASLRHGKASQVLEHDDAIAIALSLGKTYSLHSIALRSGSGVNILPIVLQLHNEYARIHGEYFNG